MTLNLLGASLFLACGGAVLLLGILILRESPDERLHRITATMMFFGGSGPLLAGLGTLLILYGPAGFRLSENVATTFACVWQFFFPSLLLFALVYPTERPILRRFHRFSVFLFGPHIFHLLLVLLFASVGGAFTIWDVGAETGGGVIDRTLAVSATLLNLGAGLLTRFHIRFFSLVDIVYSGAAIFLLYRSFRVLESPKIRRQLSVILFGLATCVGLYAIAVPFPVLFSYQVPEVIRLITVTAGLLIGTGAIAFAIVGRSFLDVGTVVRRGILLSATSTFLVLVYFFSARQLDRLLDTSLGVAFPVFQTLFVLTAIIFFHPLMGRMESTADRLLAGDRVAHRNVMRRLGREMTAILNRDRLEETILNSLREAMAVDRADLAILDPGEEYFTVRGKGRNVEIREIPREHPLARRLARTSDPELARDLVDDIADSAERDEARDLTRALGSRLLVPIHLPEGGGCIGFLSFGPKVTGARFNAEDVSLLSLLATQLGIAIRNARLHEEAVERRLVDEELAMARSIQQSILPQKTRRLAGLDVAAVSIPSRQVGGDYYDLIPLPGGRSGIAIGDVSGKGVPAALLMSMLHAALHAQMIGSPSLGPVMERMNRILCRSTSPEKFATFFFGVYEPEDGRFRFSNGGHNFPLLIRNDGSVSELEAGGLVLGMLADAGYEEEAVPLEPGDLLAFYTDGVTEEFDPEDEDHLFGEDRLTEILLAHRHESAEQILGKVREEVSRFNGGRSFSDDFTMIILRASPDGETPTEIEEKAGSLVAGKGVPVD